MSRQNRDKQLRRQLVRHLMGGEAFTPVENLVSDIPYDKIGTIPADLPYSFYQQFYHLRLAQFDILEFSRNPEYQSSKWPDEYWPEKPVPDSRDEWERLIRSYLKDREEFCNHISDPDNDLHQSISHGEGQTLFRESLLIIEHTAYHTGQLNIIAKLLNSS